MLEHSVELTNPPQSLESPKHSHFPVMSQSATETTSVGPVSRFGYQVCISVDFGGTVLDNETIECIRLTLRCKDCGALFPPV